MNPGDACFLTGNVFNFQVSQAGRFSLIRQLVLKLTSLDTSRNNWSIASIPSRPPRPPHRSTLLYNWRSLLCGDGRLPGTYGDTVVFLALENLTLDFTDWALAQDEGLRVSSNFPLQGPAMPSLAGRMVTVVVVSNTDKKPARLTDASFSSVC